VANQGAASRLDGNGGNDTLWGSALADTLNGGAGDDISTGARLRFERASGVTSFGQLGLTIAGGNTQVTHANGVILVFGASLGAGDFLFG